MKREEVHCLAKKRRCSVFRPNCGAGITRKAGQIPLATLGVERRGRMVAYWVPWVRFIVSCCTCHPTVGVSVQQKFLSPSQYRAQYLTRYNTWEKFVRATRPALVRASSSANMRVTFSSKLLVPHLGNSIGQKPLVSKAQPLPWGDSHEAQTRARRPCYM